MQEICDCKLCTGCSACAQACPIGAAAMKADDEGFLRPFINRDICVDCGLCARICPVNNALEAGAAARSFRRRGENRRNLSKARREKGEISPDESKAKNGGRKVYACCSRDEAIKAASSSGGVFTHLAKTVLAEGGVVFGAAFDRDFKVRHVYIEDERGLDSLRRSKYVQSDMGNALREAGNFLAEGRKVLFCGTPCQVAGLKAYLEKEGKKQDGLISCDMACHGVPSPKVWDMFVGYVADKYKSGIKSVSFRDKSTGWNNSSMRIDFENGSRYMDSVKREIYFIGFGKSVFNRRSCFSCLFRVDNTKADITLGDFWGIDKIGGNEFSDNKGVSLVIIHTSAGMEAFDRIREMLCVKEQLLETAIKYNPRLISSVPEPAARADFFRDLESGLDFEQLRSKYMDNRSFKYRVKCAARKILGRG